jgi:hypothetical protein
MRICDPAESSPAIEEVPNENARRQRKKETKLRTGRIDQLSREGELEYVRPALREDDGGFDPGGCVREGGRGVKWFTELAPWGVIG